jgi:hypothetical protein
MPYHVYTRSGAGALGVIVETAREALAKAAEFLEEGRQRSATVAGRPPRQSAIAGGMAQQA